MERWFTLQQRPGEKLEFWLLVAIPGGVSAVFVDTVEVSGPTPYWSNAETYPGVFQIERRQGYRLKRLESTRLPYLEAIKVEPVLSTETRDKIIQAEQNLLSGQDPGQVRDQLQALRNSGRFNCRTHQVCDRFRYVLGLAAELAGDMTLARDTYIELWWENSASPLAAAARLKLFFIPLKPTPSATASFTPTLTATAPSPTATPTVPTPSPTVTP